MGRSIEVKKGERYGKLTIIKEVESIVSGGQKKRMFKCECDCGEVLDIRLNDLRTGNSKTCGCPRGRKHGMRDHYLYQTWLNMKSRCYNTNHRRYPDWGGRGIWVQDNWIDDAAKFINYLLNTLGHRPEGMSLDRKNNDLGYIEGNLKWSTDKEQSNNRRNVKKKPPIKEV